MKNNTNKIGVATVYTGFNYGSALQAFATTRILTKLGMTTELLKLRGGLIAGRDIRIKKLLTIGFRSLCHSGGIKSLKNYRKSISKNLSEESMALFNSFTNDKLCPIEMSYSELKSRAYTDEYKAFLCGSDQVWNSAVFYIDPFYYLQFAPKDKRIAFAPSFGREYVPGYNKKRIAKYLSEIPYKSIREASGVNIIKELTGDDAEVLLDPTLVLSADEWRDSLDIRKSNDEKYLLAYFLDPPSELALQTIDKVSKQHGLRVIGLPYQMDNIPWSVVSAGPKEFVEFISSASFVCTDSFHGTAFSLNFNVPFYTFERNYGDADKQSTRIVSILDYVGAKSRLDPTTMGDCMQIQFGQINERLLDKQKVSYEYLSRIIDRNA